MPEFMLLIRNGNGEPQTPEESQMTVQKYIAWARKLRDEGRLKGGDELQDNGRILKKENGSIVEQSITGTKGTVGGYFLIEADSYDQATAISKECPTFDHGGWVEIRAVSLYQ